MILFLPTWLCRSMLSRGVPIVGKAKPKIVNIQKLSEIIVVSEFFWASVVVFSAKLLTLEKREIRDWKYQRRQNLRAEQSVAQHLWSLDPEKNESIYLGSPCNENSKIAYRELRVLARFYTQCHCGKWGWKLSNVMLSFCKGRTVLLLDSNVHLWTILQIIGKEVVTLQESKARREK